MMTQQVVDGWATLPFDECVVEPEERRKPIPRHQYRRSGAFPIVDQSQETVGGYTEDAGAAYQRGLPLILFGDHTRVFKFIDFPFATGADGTKLFRANEAIFDPRFLYFALRGLDIPSRGYNRHFLLLREMRIAFPRDKREQRAIANTLGLLGSAIGVQKKTVVALHDLKAATMAKLFHEGLRGGPVRETEVGNLPSSWALRTLRELLAEAIRNGHSAPETPDQQGVWTLTLSAVTRRDFSPASTKLTSADPRRVADLWLRDGDVFVERANTIEMVGLAALYRGPSDYAIFPDLLMRVRIEPDTLEPEILVEWLLLPWCRSYFSRHAGGAATNMPKIDQGTLERVPVPVPPREERAELVSVIQTLDRSVLRAKAKKKALEDLFSSALQSLLSGDLRITALTED